MTVATALTSRDPRHPTRLLKKKNMASGYPLSRSDHSAHGEPGNRRSRRSGMGLGGKPHCSVRVANSLLVGPRPIAGPAGRAVRGPRTSGGTYSNARTGAGALDAAPARGARHHGAARLDPRAWTGLRVRRNGTRAVLFPPGGCAPLDELLQPRPRSPSWANTVMSGQPHQDGPGTRPPRNQSSSAVASTSTSTSGSKR